MKETAKPSAPSSSAAPLLSTSASSAASPSASSSSATSSASLAGRSARERERILAAVEAHLPRLLGLRFEGKRIETVGFFVSQYWDDEADDAVHADYRYSFDRTDDAARLHEPGRFAGDDDASADDVDVNADHRAFDEDVFAGFPWFNPNDELITAFASYACESNQDDREYVPFCLWHREGDTFRRTIVGTVLRPQWEDAGGFADAPPPALANATGHQRLLVGATVLLAALWAAFAWWRGG